MEVMELTEVVEETVEASLLDIGISSFHQQTEDFMLGMVGKGGIIS